MFSRPTDVDYVDRNKYAAIPFSQLNMADANVKYKDTSTMLIAEHLERFKMWRSPIIVYRGTIIKGSLRCYCLEQSGSKTVNCVPLEDYLPDVALGKLFNYATVKQFLDQRYGALHTLCLRIGSAPFYKPVVFGMNGTTAGAVETLLFNLRKQIQCLKEYT